ncbi:hypothetical protein [Chitinophaga sp. XS-30]|uniref:hypothetical protein n=1 Tax=Chitinophaga sp. XS-30 TaxID=2604421 RepID=UPI001FEE4656|nr:hypothetical protein [Chitinophaga sp. XS-30]
MRTMAPARKTTTITSIPSQRSPRWNIIATQPNGNFMPHHHTTKDNISVIDRRTMQAVGQTLLNVIYGQPFNY